jgi:hypothetical protein
MWATSWARPLRGRYILYFTQTNFGTFWNVFGGTTVARDTKYMQTNIFKCSILQNIACPVRQKRAKGIFRAKQKKGMKQIFVK